MPPLQGMWVQPLIVEILQCGGKEKKEGKILCNTILLLYCSFFLDVCHHYCVNSESCTIGDDGSVECVCPIRYEGSKCEIDKCIRCHGGHCIINKDSEDISCK